MESVGNITGTEAEAIIEATFQFDDTASEFGEDGQSGE
jgi:hypothetical protein